ncbi:MAG: hypothetical protein QM749_18370 [Aquabacterium sp.]
MTARIAVRIACAWALIHVGGHVAWAAPAPKDHVYRCQQGDGAFAYSQWPCAPQAELIKASDPRTESQLRQSLLNDQRETKLAAQMTRARRHEERAAADQHAQALTRSARPRHAQLQPVVSPGSVTPLPKASSEASSTTYRPHGHRHFRALVPKASPDSKAAHTSGSNS